MAQVGIQLDAGRRLRVDIKEGAASYGFQELRCAAGFVYIGIGNWLFVIRPEVHEVRNFLLEGYFGHLYTAEELQVQEPTFAVLAASASELLCFSVVGTLQWRRSQLGIDGVIVLDVADGVLSGEGEWDPPGGWHPFSLCLSTGQDIDRPFAT